MTAGVQLLVPIKPLRLAKSRLLGAADNGVRHPDAHASLVLAVARDTVAAARRATAVRDVVVVTADPELTACFTAAGVEVLPDAPTAGLNAALRHADTVLRARDRTTRIGALQADLPALRSAELSAALDAAGTRRAFCPDRQGSGTTLLVAESGTPLAPRFGPDSARLHSDDAKRLDGPWDSLQCDVDTAADLTAATRLGLGPHTRARLAPHTTAGEPS